MTATISPPLQYVVLHPPDLPPRVDAPAHHLRGETLLYHLFPEGWPHQPSRARVRRPACQRLGGHGRWVQHRASRAG
ncbi:hypothetical protein BC936DRAFT_144167 [Jimgerdemannia flammicorona]|uniref:Uncharacterized protein n=1 Tax=Jimgerdemannia flammicorona TaxID=994334 RepID=A0A432ZY61_9FUNG|nr:hypothetical protein BC936DRAFT_144167 [Jimgerdemannia flammicorona]